MNVEEEMIAFDKVVRHHVYGYVMREGLPPTMAETASVLFRSPDEVKASFQRLADAHVLVLQKGSGEVLMANPFSAVPTPFVVNSRGRSYFGNCIWDALGIPAMLKQDASIEASCGCCGTAMNLQVTNGSLGTAPGIAHFAIPAAHWWDDIVFN
jgi:hypothetical protein